MKILTDHSQQKFLDENGYVILDLLNKGEVTDFLAEYELQKLNLPFAKGVHITLEHAAAEVRHKVSERLIELAYKKFSKVFANYKLLHGNFFVKSKADETNAIGLHRDWSIVDEKNGLSSYTLWVALCDITREMGTIGVLPGSHHQIKHIKHIVPKEKYQYSSDVVSLAEGKEIQYLELKAGQAVLWDHRLVHNSLPNFSNKDRVNMTFAVTGKKAQLKLYWMDNTDQLLEYDVPDDFYNLNNTETLYDYYCSGRIPEGALAVNHS